MTAEQKKRADRDFVTNRVYKKRRVHFWIWGHIRPQKGCALCGKNGFGKRKSKQGIFWPKKQYGKKEVTVYGKYQASEGDIIEMREGGSWKNDYRYFFFIVKEGKLEKFGSSSSSTDKLAVEKYLRDRKNWYSAI